MDPILKVEKIGFKYYKTSVLKDIDFNVEKGSFISILGPNGSGKTTLLKNICGLLKPESGSITLSNKNLLDFKQKDLAKTVAVVHQTKDVGFNFTVFDTVLMGRFPYIKRFEGETAKDIEITKEAMVSTGLWELKDKDIREISGGEKQRVMIARALVQEPELLILDEPIAHLDIKHQINILELCKKQNREKNITIITSLHDINLAGRYSDYIILLNKGQVIAQDRAEKVLTVENIESVYEIQVELLQYGEKSLPYIIPKASNTK